MTARTWDEEHEEGSARRPEETAPAPAWQPEVRNLLRMQQTAGNQAVARMLSAGNARMIQRIQIGGIEVNKSTNMPTWDVGDVRYHINLTTDPPHVTRENKGSNQSLKARRTHFFFTRDLMNNVCIDGKIPKESRGGESGSKKKFSALPKDVQTFVSTHYDALIG